VADKSDKKAAKKSEKSPDYGRVVREKRTNTRDPHEETKIKNPTEVDEMDRPNAAVVMESVVISRNKRPSKKKTHMADF
jgi:hypothetical protein